MDALLQAIANYIANLAYQIQQYVGTLMQSVAQVLGQLAQTLLRAVTDTMNQIITYFSVIVQDIKLLMTQLLTTLQTMVNTVLDRIAFVIAGLLDKIKGFFDYVTGWIVALIQGAMAYIRDTYNAIAAQVTRIATAVLDEVKGIATRVGDTVKAFFDNIAARALAVWEDIVRKVQQSYETLLQGANAIITTVNERILGLREAFLQAATTLVSGLTGVAEDTLGPISTAIREHVDSWLKASSPAEIKTMWDGFSNWTSGHSLALQSREDAQRYFTSMIPAERVGRFFFLLAANVFAVMRVYSGIADANAQVVLQEFATTYSYQLPSVPDVIVGIKKGIIPYERGLQLINRQGYSLDDARGLVLAADVAPPVADLFHMWHRGIITDKHLEDGLEANAIAPRWRGQLQAASEIHPPVQDLITMAVRDVFEPATAEKFGQFGEFPAAFKEEAAKAGLSEKWARNYWAAHWSLPSAQQGFEMLHRGAISDAELDTLLKALDVMPFWRTGLKAISYNVLTRVDIRRMHQLGVLDDAGVLKAHRELGYNEEHAKLLTEFTLKLNKHAPADDDEELGRLTRASILGFYVDGLLSQERAVALLIGLGLTEEAAALYVSNADMDAERTARQEQTQLVIDRFGAGAISFEGAQDELGQLNLTAREQDRAFTRLVQIQAKGTRLPTKSEGEALVKAGVIGADDYADLLSRLGYAPVWVNAFVALLKVKNAPAS